MKELSLSGWELANSLRGYIQVTGRGGKWRETISRLEHFENHRDANGEPVALSPGMQNTIAGQWIREDFVEGMRWYAEEISRDYTNPKEVKNVASVLAGVPMEDQFLVVDWLASQKGEPGWSDALVMTIGKAQARSEPNETTGRLVGLISNEADRFKLVTQFVGGTSASSIRKLRHSPDALNRLVEAARLTEANAAQLKDAIAASKWSGM